MLLHILKHVMGEQNLFGNRTRLGNQYARQEGRMAAFQITNIHVFWDTTPSRQISEASAVSVFRVQYFLPGLLNQALKSSFGLRMSWK